MSHAKKHRADLRQPKAWQSIGRAYQEHQSQIAWERFAETLAYINSIYQSAQQGISHLHEKSIISHGTKLANMFALQSSGIGQLVKALNCITFHTVRREAMRQILRQAAIQEGLSENALTHDELSAADLGQRIASEFDRCLHCIEDAEASETKDEPLETLIRILTTSAIDELLVQFRATRILDRCSNCRRTMFPSTPTKRFCSSDCEGRDCGHRYRARESYRKKRQGLRMTPVEAGRLAANIRWQRERNPKRTA